MITFRDTERDWWKDGECASYADLEVDTNTVNAVAQLIEGLCYTPEGRGFDSWWGHWDISLT